MKNKMKKIREITTIILASVAFIIIMGLSLYEAGLATTLSILGISLGISLGMTGIAMYFYFKQSKEVDTIKVGDIVYFNELESEVIEADESTLVVKTKVNRMKVSIKK